MLRGCGPLRPVAPIGALLGVALCQCGTTDGERTNLTRGAILGGALADAAEVPTLLLQNPEGFCSAVLIAPNLVATARHCVATLTLGAVSCSAQGTLTNSSVGGALGAEFAPTDLSFFSSGQIFGGSLGAADATGTQIFSTGAVSVCRDDLAFVVLNQPVVTAAPVPVRIHLSTRLDEPVSVWGYGLGEEASKRLELRVRPDAQIAAIGPDSPPTLPQAAPVRSVLVGPDAVGCNGDSGGPILSNATGALIAVVSIGTESVTGGSCTPNNMPSTTGPRLSQYADLALAAFAAAGATPIFEPGGEGDAPTDAPAPEASTEAGPPAAGLDAAEEPGPSVVPVSTTGGCGVAHPGHRWQGRSTLGVALVAAVLALGRRQR